ncbi:upstream activation factor subunit spp27 [Folsomia candida]|uniref:upstream activation factor subunit spp27 n=1 Tax=Folsomia candida TaxID=158441 RepID=UPI000B8FED53|nr:upstream activation factor subunit spp27 [Folsomia candida]
MANTAQLRKLIAEILETADLNSITAKKVRQELETKLDEDLSEKKKEIDNLVLEILEDKQNGAGDDKGSKRKTKDESESEEEDTPKKKRGKKASDDDDDSEEEPKKKKKPAAKGKGGYVKKCRLSPELAKVMGEENMARHEVVKKMWGIIKEKQLYDPKNKQFAICNADLLAVFGVKRFRTFGMMKYLKTHFLD